LLCSPVLQFCRRKKIKQKTWHFSLFEIKVAIQGVSLWYFHVYMYYNPNCFISSNFCHSILVPFLMVVSVGLIFILI
jgi:hypothetical protein